MNITILGGGMIGSAIAQDLSRESDFTVTVADRDPAALQKCAAAGIETVQADLADTGQLLSVIDNAELVIGAVPGFMGYSTLQHVIEAGKK